MCRRCSTLQESRVSGRTLFSFFVISRLVFSTFHMFRRLLFITFFVICLSYGFCCPPFGVHHIYLWVCTNHTKTYTNLLIWFVSGCYGIPDSFLEFGPAAGDVTVAASDVNMDQFNFSISPFQILGYEQIYPGKVRITVSSEVAYKVDLMFIL